MSTIDEAPDINKKKKEKKGNIDGDELTLEKGQKFLVSVVYLVVIVFAYFTVSGLVLFGCKAAFAKLIPTSEDCKPYEDTPPIYKDNLGNPINKIECNIFETLFEDDKKSDTFWFNTNNIRNSDNSFLDWLRDKKNDSNSRFFYYLYIVIEKIFLFDFVVLNWMFGWLNGLPEWIVVLFGPIIFIFIGAILIGCSSIYYVLLSIITPFSVFLKEKANKGDLQSQLPNGITWEKLPNKYKWKEMCGWSWWIGLGFAFFLLLFMLVFFAISAPMAALITIWCLATIFSYVGYKNETIIVDNVSKIVEEKVTVSKVIGETYGQYKSLIAFIVTILVILTAFSNLGVYSGVTSILIGISIYFQWIPITIFEKFDYTRLTAYKNLEQPKKECPFSTRGLDEIKYKDPSDCDYFTSFNIFGINFAALSAIDKAAKAKQTAIKNTSEAIKNTSEATINTLGATTNTLGATTNTLGAATTNTLGAATTNTGAAATKEAAATVTGTGQKGGSITPRNKTLSKYKNKYNVLNF